ncbi:hypothetical protein [Alkaliphilus sp. B6464]|uniref:hypothetical protein n=1 Tax=Alkaliphilus sp. B6464 TaxID=2731219 RepID=UPI001BA7A9B1|nr:hypothetical protein [Alkaliphilus sp. B6464]QUH21870.1 hypothetical protein HYG84_18205 [Alkaliphilus sp. B6464]
MKNSSSIWVTISKREQELIIMALDYTSNTHYKTSINKHNKDVLCIDYIISELLKDKFQKIGKDELDLYDVEIHYTEVNVLLFALYYFAPYISKDADSKILTNILTIILCETIDIKAKSKEYVKLDNLDKLNIFIEEIKTKIN